MKVPSSGHFQAFSVIVDINRFTCLVSNHQLPGGISQYVRDVLTGSIAAIEKSGGSVIGVMGDAIFGILSSADEVVTACSLIARDLNRTCEYLSGTEYEVNIPELPSLKIGVEYGWLDADTIFSTALGTIPFYIGPATNYAARIIAAGKGNRCHVGLEAMEAGLDKYIERRNVCTVKGKDGERNYKYWRLDLSDIWIEDGSGDGGKYW